MWKFLEQLKADFEHEKAELDGQLDQQREEEQTRARFLDQALQKGADLVWDNAIHSPETGVIDAINDASDSIEFYFQDGGVLWITFLLTRPGMETLVSAGQSVKDREVLARFLQSGLGAQVSWFEAEDLAQMRGEFPDLFEEDGVSA